MISIKNSRDAVRHLLSVSNATHLIVDNDFASYAESLELDIPTVVFEDVSQLKAEDTTIYFGAISEEQRDAERNLPAFYLHTSGSTGHPKIIAEVYDLLYAFYLIVWAHSSSKDSQNFYWLDGIEYT